MNDREQTELMKRFPAVELSYETHKKVSDTTATKSYDVVVAIPFGKKAFLWWTYWKDRDVCLLLELGKDRRVIHMQLVGGEAETPWSYGTVLYGAMVETTFVVEDVLQCRGILLHKQPFGEKLAFFREMMENHVMVGRPIVLPYMAMVTSHTDIPSQKELPYPVHHFQYRSLTGILPYMNVSASDNKSSASSSAAAAAAVTPVLVEEKAPRCDFKKPQYRKPTVFEVRADLQNDIYRLYTDDNRQYYGLAYIPNYRTSVLMNGLFRNIKENRNLDALEESDDEEDFQDCRPTKYVNLEKRVLMECVFHPKFKRWMPRSVVAHAGQKHKSLVISATKL